MSVMFPVFSKSLERIEAEARNIATINVTHAPATKV